MAMSGTTIAVFTFRPSITNASDIDGYAIRATDGEIGKVDKHNDEAGRSYLLVATGPWILGKMVMLPAGVIDRIDHDDKVVYVSRTKEQIKNAPEYEESQHDDDAYRTGLGDYYSRVPL